MNGDGEWQSARRTYGLSWSISLVQRLAATWQCAASSHEPGELSLCFKHLNMMAAS